MYYSSETNSLVNDVTLKGGSASGTQRAEQYHSGIFSAEVIPAENIGQFSEETDGENQYRPEATLGATAELIYEAPHL